MRACGWIVLAVAVLIALCAASIVVTTTAAGGCGAELTGVPRTGTTAHSLISAGTTRCYRLHIPDGLDVTRPAPLVVSLHGFSSNALGQEYLSRWNAVAEREGFIVVYPQGTGWPLRWNSSNDFEASSVDDVQFLRDLIVELVARLNIDPGRIYINGMSNGGAMTSRAACEMSDVIAAAGVVSGPTTTPPGGCSPSRPVALIAFYGTDDPLVPFQGSGARSGEMPWWTRWMRMRVTSAFQPVEAWVVEWADRDGCPSAPEALPPHGSVSGIRFGGCADGAEVILYTIAGGGHAWPGGGATFIGSTTRDLSATETMWEFFLAHPLVR